MARSHKGNALVCKTKYKGSTPFLAYFFFEPVAQLVERTPDEGEVGSSSLPRFKENLVFFKKKKKSKKKKDRIR